MVLTNKYQKMSILRKMIQLSPNVIFILFLIFVSGIHTAQGQNTEEEQGQGKDEKDTRPVRSTFESTLLIDNQSVMVSGAKTFQSDIQHRFGIVKNGYDDLIGLYAPSNIRLGFGYTPIEKLAVGFGLTKNNLLWDFSAKYAIVQQARKGGMPLSITAYANAAIDTRKKENFLNSSDRLSYFYQVIIARKVNRLLSVQIAPNLSHFNAITEGMQNDHFGISFAGRMRLGETKNSSVIFEIDQPLTAHSTNNPNPNLSLGYEVSTSGHAFQIFVGNYNKIINQYNNVNNQNDFRDSEFLIGFNITRLWGF